MTSSVWLRCLMASLPIYTPCVSRSVLYLPGDFWVLRTHCTTSAASLRFAWAPEKPIMTKQLESSSLGSIVLLVTCHTSTSHALLFLVGCLSFVVYFNSVKHFGVCFLLNFEENIWTLIYNDSTNPNSFIILNVLYIYISVLTGICKVPFHLK